MRTVDLLLLIAAAVCFALATTGITKRVNLVALGLLCWVLIPLIAALRTY